MAIEAGMDDVLRLVCLISLRNEASAICKLGLNGGRKLWKCVHWKMADEVGSRAAVDDCLAGSVKERGRLLREIGKDGTAEKRDNENGLATRVDHQGLLQRTV